MSVRIMRNWGRTVTARACWLTVAAVGLAWGQRAGADTALAWGKNNFYQVGDGTTDTHYTPVPVSGLGSDVTAVAAGGRFGLALTDAGAVYAWGASGGGSLGDGNLNDHVVSPAQQVIGLSDGVTAMAAVNGDGYALRDGAVYAWGLNFDGTIGDGSTTQYATPIVLPGLSSGVTAIFGGHGMFAVRNGAVYVWGSQVAGDGTLNTYFVPTVVPTLTGVTSLSSGGDHGLAIKNGAAYAWGYNWNGQLGDGTNNDNPVPTPVPGLSSGVTAVSAAGAFSVALKDGHVYTWGRNDHGQLGDGTTNDSLVAEEVDPGKVKDIVAISAGNDSTYALAADGSIWVWGENGYGELGLGNSDVLLTPQHLFAPPGYHFTSIDGGDIVSDLLPPGYAVYATVNTPEPAGLSLLAMGALAVTRRSRRRRRRQRR